MTTVQRIGPYRLEEELGRGGMGVVYAAFDPRLERRVAMKRVATRADNARRRRRLRREARLMARLAHPAIVQVFDLVSGDDADWIVMERVDGVSLTHHLARGTVDVETTLRIAHQLAEGLSVAHRAGIVHRDLKTENVMVLPEGQVKILDFGVAKRFDRSLDGDLSQQGALIGTSRAMAPEQARGLAVGPRADLFSLGVLLYECLTGVSPFRAESPAVTLVRVLTHQPPPVDQRAPEVPRAVAALVERLLRKAPELRPASADEVANELERLLDDRGTVAEDTGRADERSGGGVQDDRATGDETVLESFDAGPSVPESRPKESRGSLALALVLALTIGTAALLVVTLGPGGRGADVDADGAVADDSSHASVAAAIEREMAALRRVDRPERLDEAIEVFRRAVDRPEASAAAYAGLARAYWEKSRNASAGGDPAHLENALAMAREAVSADPTHAAARTSLGLVHYAQGRLDAAVAELERALELDPSQADALYGLGKVAEARQAPEEVEAFYRRALAVDPQPLYLDALGAFLYKQGRHDAAEEAFRHSLDLAPDNLHALRNLGSVYYSQGRVDDAVVQLQAALKLRPDASLYSNLGTIFYSRGLYSKAAEAFEAALQLDGAANRYVFWFNLADAYRQLPDREDAARRSYRRAIQILDRMLVATPDDARLLCQRALAHARDGSLDAARQDAARAHEVGVGDVYSRFLLAIAEELYGERESALAGLEVALQEGLPLAEVRFEPDLAALRRDVRFHHLLVTLDAEP
ncbi:MAG: protein kinase [Acidobacteriota bacterium]